MRPQLRPGVPLVWRTDELLQLGVDPERAVAASVTAAEYAWLTSLDGCQTAADAVAGAHRAGLTTDAAHALLALLQQVGGLEDAGVDVPELRTATAAERSRLAPDVAAIGLALGEPGSGAAAMTARRSARVEIRGTGRVAAATAALLAASGVGRLNLETAEITGESSPFTAELGPGSTLGAAVARCAPSTRVSGLARDGALPPPDFVVLADQAIIDPEETAELVAADVPHLQVHAEGHRAVIGPLVLPGRTACLRCIHLTRRDRDATWPRQAAQLGRLQPRPPVDVLLATIAGALAARRVCGVLESALRVPRATPQAGAGHTIEFDLVTQEFTQRVWPPHPVCGCTWPG
jgi:bacteriocin biosynthesis cyclodehydratase domain-containing protein